MTQKKEEDKNMEKAEKKVPRNWGIHSEENDEGACTAQLQVQTQVSTNTCLYRQADLLRASLYSPADKAT